jgi:hypothetical protein
MPLRSKQMQIILGLLLLAMFGLIALMLLAVAGPRKTPSYSEIKHDDGTVHYYVNGFITPLKPEPRPFLQRLVEMDGLFGGWSDGGMGADG